MPSKGQDCKSHSLLIGSFLDSVQDSGLTAFTKKTTCSYPFITGLLKTSLSRQGFPDGLDCKESGCNSGGTGDVGLTPGSGRSPGEGHGYPPVILAWRIPWTEEPGGLQSMGSLRVGHD